MLCDGPQGSGSSGARRWLVDGMNVIGSKPDKWWNDPNRAMRALVERLDGYARLTGDEVFVVLDRHPGSLPERAHAALVIASRRGRNAADHEIVDMVMREQDRSRLWVVTSDKRLKERVTALEAHVVPSRRFRNRIEATLGGSAGTPSLGES